MTKTITFQKVPLKIEFLYIRNIVNCFIGRKYRGRVLIMISCEWDDELIQVLTLLNT